jgi:hypothetical protein
MPEKERPLSSFIRLLAYTILLLNVLFIIVAIVSSESLIEVIGRIYDKYGHSPGGFSLFVYQYYQHLWFSYAIMSAAMYVIGFRFYYRSNLTIEKRIFFLQFIFFTNSLALVIFFVVLFLALFEPMM